MTDDKLLVLLMFFGLLSGIYGMATWLRHRRQRWIEDNRRRIEAGFPSKNRRYPAPPPPPRRRVP